MAHPRDKAKAVDKQNGPDPGGGIVPPLEDDELRFAALAGHTYYIGAWLRFLTSSDPVLGEIGIGFGLFAPTSDLFVGRVEIPSGGKPGIGYLHTISILEPGVFETTNIRTGGIEGLATLIAVVKPAYDGPIGVAFMPEEVAGASATLRAGSWMEWLESL